MNKRYFDIFSLWIHANVEGDKALIESMPNIIKDCPSTRLIFKVQYEQTKEHFRWAKPYILGHGIKESVYWLTEGEPYKNMARYYQRSNLYASVGGTIGLEFPFIEANACGLPVVGLNAGTAPELIRDGYNGVLCNEYTQIKRTDMKGGIPVEETYLIPSAAEIAEKIKPFIVDRGVYNECS
jgi:glycosyltransferase involved in cell wall biosynthesis